MLCSGVATTRGEGRLGASVNVFYAMWGFYPPGGPMYWECDTWWAWQEDENGVLKYLENGAGFWDGAFTPGGAWVAGGSHPIGNYLEVSRAGFIPLGWFQSIAPHDTYEYILIDAVPFSTDPENVHPHSPCKTGMAGYEINRMQGGLVIGDHPLSYEPAYGPALDFRLSYDQFDRANTGQEAHGHLGPGWVHNWIAYVIDEPKQANQAKGGLEFEDTEDAATAGQTGVHHVITKRLRRKALNMARDGNPIASRVLARTRGGGGEHYESSTAAPGDYGIGRKSQARLARIGTGFQRTYPDGRVETFGHDAGLVDGEHRYYLTSLADADGNTVTLQYTGDTLTSVTDATGGVTTFTYFQDDATRLWQVTDPNGRTVEFTYHESGQLWKITDPVGIVSAFSYGERNAITELTTPYGTSRFSSGVIDRKRWIVVTDPMGGRERVEVRLDANPVLEAGEAVPAGFSAANFTKATTYYWNKKAMEGLQPGELPADADAETINWLYHPGGDVISGIPGSEKAPGESRVWFQYAGQPTAREAGPSAQPSKVARMLDAATEQKTTMLYNGEGQPTQIVDPKGRTTNLTYHANQVDLDEVRRVTGMGTYDVVAKFSGYANHHPLTIIDAAGQATSVVYGGPGGQVSQITNAKGEVTKIDYVPAGTAGAGKVQTVTRAFGTALAASTSYTYDAQHRLATVTDSEDNYTVTIGYDAIGGDALKTLDRPTTKSYPDGTAESVTWDRLHADTSTDRLDRVTLLDHDALGRVIKVTDPLGRIVQYDWCLCGSLEQITDAAQHVTGWLRDVRGRPTEKKIEGTTVASYLYDAAGRLSSVTDAKQQTVTYGYDVDDRLLSIDYDDANTADVSFTYDSIYGRLATMSDGTGTTSYGYVPMNPADAVHGDGQLASVDGPLGNDTLSYSYDELGRQVGGPRGAVSGFDELGRVTEWSNGLGTFTPNYVGKTGRIDTVDQPGGRTLGFDWFTGTGDFRLKQMKHLGPAPGAAAVSQFDYSFDAAGRIGQWRQWHAGLGAQAQARRWVPDYDEADQLTGVAVKDDTETAVLDNFEYRYDLAGNRYATRDAVWGRNAFNQLTAQGTSGGVQTLEGTVSEAASVKVQTSDSWEPVPATVVPDGALYRWSAQVTAWPGPNTYYVYATETNPKPNHPAQKTTWRVTLNVPSQALSYDENGNMTSDAGMRTFEWDAANRLVAINYTGTAKRSEFAYDGMSRRVRVIEKDGTTVLSDRRLVWDGLEEYEERDTATNAVLKQFYAEGEVRFQSAITGQSAEATYLYTRDHLGSVREVIDLATNQLMARYDYDPYGVRTKVGGVAGFEADFGYTGHLHHGPSGLALAPFRSYDSNLGRWLSRDPISELGGSNLYAYVQGNPAGFLDPDGLSPAWADMRGLPNYSGPSSLNLAPLPEGAASVAGAIVGIFVEPVDWGMTALEIIHDPTNPWSYVGAIPFVPSSAGMVGKIIKRGIGGKGWRGDKFWRRLVKKCENGGDVDLEGQIPTKEEALDLLREAGIDVDSPNIRIEAHAPGGVSTHTYPHINYLTPTAKKGNIRILSL